jgi:hypothetical protein
MPWCATELELRRLFYWSMRFTHWDSVRYVATVVAANEQLVLGGTSGASKTSAPQDLNLYTNFNVRLLQIASSLPKFCTFPIVVRWFCKLPLFRVVFNRKMGDHYAIRSPCTHMHVHARKLLPARRTCRLCC